MKVTRSQLAETRGSSLFSKYRRGTMNKICLISLVIVLAFIGLLKTADLAYAADLSNIDVQALAAETQKQSSNDFGALLYIPIQDLELEETRLQCLRVPEEFPSENEGIWCG